MKLSGFRFLAALCSASVAFSGGCTVPSDSTNVPHTESSSTSSNAATTAAPQSGSVTPDTISDKEATAAVKWDSSVTFSDDALAIKGNGVHASGTTAVITKAGTYRITGSCSDGAILVNAGGDDKVTLLLDGVDLANKSGCVILGENADRLTISLAAGSDNIISDAASYSDTGEDAPDSAIFCRDDLVFNGDGRLTVNARFNDAVKCKDSLKIAGGEITVISADDGVVGKDCLIIGGGTVTVDAYGDALKSTNDADEGMGYISVTEGALNLNSGDDAANAARDIIISGGSLGISAEGDALHAENIINISGGDINITKSYEALEGLSISISGGRINAVAANDGINAAGGDDAAGDRHIADSENSGNYISMTNGEVTLNAAGDGIDSNGTVALSGGVLRVFGPENGANGALDYQHSFAVNGGTLIALGARQMAMAPSTLSQPCLSVYGDVKAGARLEVLDESGNAIISVTTPKQCDSLIFSSDRMVAGSTYTITADGSTIATVEAVNGVSGGGATGDGFGGWGNFGDMGGGFGGDKPDGFGGGHRPDRRPPEDFVPPAPPEDTTTA